MFLSDSEHAHTCVAAIQICLKCYKFIISWNKTFYCKEHKIFTQYEAVEKRKEKGVTIRPLLSTTSNNNNKNHATRLRKAPTTSERTNDPEKNIYTFLQTPCVHLRMYVRLCTSGHADSLTEDSRSFSLSLSLSLSLSPYRTRPIHVLIHWPKRA